MACPGECAKHPRKESVYSVWRPGSCPAHPPLQFLCHPDRGDLKLSMPNAVGQSPSLDPHKSICHGQQPPPDHSSPSASPSQLHLRPPVARRLLPDPSHYIPSIYPPPPTSWWRSALGPGSRAPRHARRAHPSCPHPPGSRNPLTATSVLPPHPTPRPGGSSPNAYRTRARESSPSTPASAFLPPHAAAASPPLPSRPRGWGPPFPSSPSSPPPQPVVLSSGPQSRPHPTSRKPSAQAPPPRLAISPTLCTPTPERPPPATPEASGPPL
nr:extensin-like [Globicephala melas]